MDLFKETLANTLENEDVNGILAVGPAAFNTAYGYLKETSRLCSSSRNINNSNCVYLATFDENEQILKVDPVTSRTDGVKSLYRALWMEVWHSLWTVSCTFKATWPLFTSHSVLNSEPHLVSIGRH